MYAGVDSAADIIGKSVTDIFLWTKDVNRYYVYTHIQP
jgi:hypothetical protein